MSNATSKLRGAWPTMVTPFDDGGKIDAAAYRAMVD